MSDDDDKADASGQQFLAQITDAIYETTGTYAGLWMYSWVAQSPYSNTTAYTPLNTNPPRTGTYTSPNSFGAAIENNNLACPVGSFVWLTYKCWNGSDLYTFDLDSGNYLVTCTSATATAGWYPGTLKVWNPTTQLFYQPQQWDKTAGAYITSTVWLRDVSGSHLVVGSTYPAQYVGLYSAVASFVTAASAGGYTRGFFAQLTTVSAGVWKFKPWSSGVLGTETTTYCATPYAGFGVSTTGQNVWMTESSTPGAYEFLALGLETITNPGLLDINQQYVAGKKDFVSGADGTNGISTDIVYLPSNTGSGTARGALTSHGVVALPNPLSAGIHMTSGSYILGVDQTQGIYTFDNTTGWPAPGQSGSSGLNQGFARNYVNGLATKVQIHGQPMPAEFDADVVDANTLYFSEDFLCLTFFDGVGHTRYVGGGSTIDGGGP